MNTVSLVGVVHSEPVFEYEIEGIEVFSFLFATERTSGTIDYLPVCFPSDIMDKINQSDRIGIMGEWRSRNVEGHVLMYVWAKEIFASAFPDLNLLQVKDGYVCKEPVYRKTPLGREIADLLIAVNRPNGKSDYMPCVAWGRSAKYSERNLTVGDMVEFEGRLQSREYIKKLKDTEETRTAFEVSISSIKKIEKE